MTVRFRISNASLLRRVSRPRALSSLLPPPTHVRALSLSPRLAAPPSFTVNQGRLWDTVHYTAQWGDSKDGGVRRLALTDEDKAVREWFVGEAQKYGATVRVDEMGNIFAVRPGQNNDLPPIGVGSHLDTQPAGGRYDGILGVQAGLEILKTLEENNHTTYAPIAVISTYSPYYTTIRGSVLTNSRLDKRRRRTLQNGHDLIGSLGRTGEPGTRIRAS